MVKMKNQKEKILPKKGTKIHAVSACINVRSLLLLQNPKNRFFFMTLRKKERERDRTEQENMSSELKKDPKIKLFGTTIQLPAAQTVGAADECSLSDSVPEKTELNGDEQDQEFNKCLSGPKQTKSQEEDQAKSSTSEEFKESNVRISLNEGSKMVKASDIEEENQDADNSEETLKKPDKIIRCPRCNSMETKFCYFNNYNVNQPRHFCRNCQRYWTAGGNMRNVPIGAGRRRYKHVPPQYRHIAVPESLTGGQTSLSNGIHHPALNPSGNALGLRSVTPLCESMVSGLSMADKTVRHHQAEELEVSASKEDRNKPLRNSSLDQIARMSSEMIPNRHPLPSKMPGFVRAPWPYPLYPTLAPRSSPVPFYPTGSPPYWNCAIPGGWNTPSILPPMQSPPSSGPTSPTLGKHSRDDNTLKLDNNNQGETKKESNPEKCFWVPKTKRIDDPGEAAKSSILEALGINKKVESGIGGGGLHRAFQSKSKSDEKAHVPEAPTVLQANPAALSRSVSFNESS